MDFNRNLNKVGRIIAINAYNYDFLESGIQNYVVQAQNKSLKQDNSLYHLIYITLGISSAFKPLIGILSDSVPIRSQRFKWYLITVNTVQVFCSLSIAFWPGDPSFAEFLTCNFVIFLCGNFNYALAQGMIAIASKISTRLEFESTDEIKDIATSPKPPGKPRDYSIEYFSSFVSLLCMSQILFVSLGFGVVNMIWPDLSYRWYYGLFPISPLIVILSAFFILKEKKVSKMYKILSKNQQA